MIKYSYMEKDLPVWNQYRPGNEPYSSARLFEILPRFFGDKGQFIVGLYAYLRWVDDYVDEGENLSKKQKLTFLERQMGLVAGFVPENSMPMESVLNDLPWTKVPEKLVRHRINIILGSIMDDVEHQGLVPRTEREIRHYNLRTMWPVVDGLFLVLNGKSMKPNRSTMDFLDSYMKIGSLEGLGDDLKQGVLKLSVPDLPIKSISTAKEVEEKFDEKWFDRQKWTNLRNMARNIGTFVGLDIPACQKLAAIAYTGEMLVRKSIKVNRKKSFETGI